MRRNRIEKKRLAAMIIAGIIIFVMLAGMIAPFVYGAAVPDIRIEKNVDLTF